MISYHIAFLASQALNPAGLEAFVAVDDFTFHRSDVCEVLPVPGPTTVPPSPTSPPCGEAEVTCGDGTCLPPSKAQHPHILNIQFHFQSCLPIHHPYKL